MYCYVYVYMWCYVYVYARLYRKEKEKRYCSCFFFNLLVFFLMNLTSGCVLWRGYFVISSCGSAFFSHVLPVYVI